MTNILFLILGLILGSFLASFFSAKKNNNADPGEKILHSDDEIDNESIGNDQTAKKIKLQPADKKLTGCIENDVAIISFYLPDMFPELLNVNCPEKSTYYFIDEVKENFAKGKLTDIALIDGCEMIIFGLLLNGKAKVYSKIDAEMVTEIQYLGKNTHNGPLSGHGELKFYLPNGKLFLKIPTWIS